jgi:transcriptional regulator of arginine metabolism
MIAKSSQNLIKDLKSLLLQGIAETQENICIALEAKGHVINQSKISRLLKKINAVKSKNEKGEMIYRLPHDILPPSIDTTLSELIIDVTDNEVMIIIRTSPGSASLIARIIDNKKCQIIGTIAGDDTIFIAPKSVKKIKETYLLICNFLGIDKDFIS